MSRTTHNEIQPSLCFVSYRRASCISSRDVGEIFGKVSAASPTAALADVVLCTSALDLNWLAQVRSSAPVQFSAIPADQASPSLALHTYVRSGSGLCENGTDAKGQLSRIDCDSGPSLRTQFFVSYNPAMYFGYDTMTVQLIV